MMKKTVISDLAEFGQSIWLDNISRSMIGTGKLKEMIDIGLRGMTSNPTIFDKAISSSADYDDKIVALHKEGKLTFQIYDDLTVKDVQDAADVFKPVYEETKGLDGYVSLEVNPKLAFSVKETVEEAKRLYEKVARPNVMFKVPSTKEGFPAISELISCGINVNITLIFSLEQYINTANAYFKGLKQFVQNGGDLSKVRSVASVFVSRVDNVVDKSLEGKKELGYLKGKAAVANSALIYKKFLDMFSSGEFKELRDKGANIQRVLWGSTSTKNPAYSDIKYVTELIAKDTVNTIPEKTFYAFLDHGKVREALNDKAGEYQKVINDLGREDIDINNVCAKLLEDGVRAFEKSFDSLLDTIEEKVKSVCSK